MFRAYDDGVAFRYVLPEQTGSRRLPARGRADGVPLRGEPPGLGRAYGSFTTPPGEGVRQDRRWAPSRPRRSSACPLLVQVDTDAWVAITEADLRDWAGMYLSGNGAAPNAVVSTLSPWPDEPGRGVQADAARARPGAC